MRRRGKDAAVAVQTASYLINTVCDVANPTAEFKNATLSFKRNGLASAVLRHDTEALFDWLMNVLSFQGIADRAARTIIERDGNATWRSIKRSLKNLSCPKLEGFWNFNRCNFQKVKFVCSTIEHLPDCPVPRHRLRNGHLNQMAYSLYFFIRDVADGDLIEWLDRLVTDYENDPRSGYLEIIDALKAVYGTSEKVWSLALASLFLGAAKVRPNWRPLGTDVIVVDRLVHNFMHRTGLISTFGRSHIYGPQCYAKLGCAEALMELSRLVNCRRFDAGFPSLFPRFVQNAVWRYCAVSEVNICNGTQIDDSQRCNNFECTAREWCARRRLRHV